MGGRDARAIFKLEDTRLSGFDFWDALSIFGRHMIKFIRLALPVFAGIALCIHPASAQTDNLRVAVAGLQQDVGELARDMKALNLEMEALRRENAQLRKQVAAASNDRGTQSQISDLSSAIETLRREYRKADESQKRQIIAEVSKQIDALAKETQAAIDTVADAVDSTPNIAPPVRFSEDYPKTGVTYVVRSGDTLSKIAREHDSTVKFIQNANKIANPARDLRVGETIFIPISE